MTPSDPPNGIAPSSDPIFHAGDYFTLAETDHRPLFEGITQAWEALAQIESYLQFRLRPAIHGRLIGRPYLSGGVYIGRNTVVEQGACIKGPAWIGNNCEIRNGAYIRENVIVGDGCVLGNSCEFKNCILFNGVQVPHFNYVGDAILGHRSHLGAGVVLSNVKLDHSEIFIAHENGSLSTGLSKFSALIGDFVEIGCHSVINPGSIIGPRACLYPGTIWRGVLPAETIVKTTQTQSRLQRRTQ